jgi:hypothetical protein
MRATTTAALPRSIRAIGRSRDLVGIRLCDAATLRARAELAILTVVTGSAVIVALVGWIAVAGTPTPTPEPGVQVDPDSPSGKEYAIPLDDARRRASPSGETQTMGAPGGGTAAAPLFGAGVTARAARSSAGEDASDGSDAKDSPTRSRSREDPTMSAPPPASVLEAASRPGAPSGGAGTTALLAGGAAALLVLGAGTGVVLRRRSRG